MDTKKVPAHGRKPATKTISRLRRASAARLAPMAEQRFELWMILKRDKAKRELEHVRENRVEHYLTIRAEQAGAMCVKLQGTKDWPDQLVIWNSLQFDLIECKRPRGGRLSSGQRRLHRELAKHGVAVQLIYLTEQVDDYIDTRT